MLLVDATAASGTTGGQAPLTCHAAEMNVDKKVLSEIISGEATAKVHYRVPPFQRPYRWGRPQWDALLADLDAADGRHFLGAIICVREAGTGMPDAHEVYDLIDGQQRLTTLSILLLAAYARLNELKSAQESEVLDPLLADRVDETARSVRNKLLVRRPHREDAGCTHTGWVEDAVEHIPRLQPGEQKDNRADYKYLLRLAGLGTEAPKPRFFGVRRPAQAFEFCAEQLKRRDPEALLRTVEDVQTTLFVFISVDSQADAFTLFETLNNRGVPLSAMDIVKNQMLARLEQRHGVKAKRSFRRWKAMLDPLPEERDQERFLRHFYHAHRLGFRDRDPRHSPSDSLQADRDLPAAHRRGRRSLVRSPRESGRPLRPLGGAGGRRDRHARGRRARRP